MTGVKKINQAVILAGGKGLRLKKITEINQKCMANINGKPFIEYLINFFKKNGIKNFLILCGYNYYQIKKYFDDGKKFGVKIQYDYQGDVQTGDRIVKALSKIDDIFLLSYADVYCDFNLKEYIKFYFVKKLQNVLIVKKSLKKNDNLNYNFYCNNNKLLFYKKNNNNHNCKDLGFGIFQKKYLHKFAHKKNFSFENFFYNKFIKLNILSGYTVYHPYVTLTDEVRLHQAQLYFSNRSYIFLDRDGVINLKKKRGRYVKSIKEFKVINKLYDAFSILKKKKYRIIIITNQAGISRGKLNESALKQIHKWFIKQLIKRNINIVDAIYYSKSFNNKNFFRKPNPGMLLQAAEYFLIRPENISFFGDSKVDQIASSIFGCKFFKITKKKTLYDYAKKISKAK